MGNQKEFIAQVEKLKKEFDFAAEMAVMINADRLKHLEKIEELELKLKNVTKELDDWIDVNDRLPYKDGDSSVYCLVNDTYDGIVVRPFNEAHNCWDQEDGDDYYTDAKGGKITHWKPLPEPPKRKQQKEK